jgi:WD40 repeat protein
MAVLVTAIHVFLGAARRRGYPASAGHDEYGSIRITCDFPVVALLSAATHDPDFRPTLRWPSLTPPGAERLRLVGHEDGVNLGSFSPDGTRIVTASHDCTARIWDAATG